MNYPIPRQRDFFLYKQKKNIKEKFNSESFSRNQKNPYMDKFIQEINKHWKLYRSIPFVSEIYLCNSITFNALKEDSDIDLFIITKKDSIRRARFFSILFFTILWLKRSLKNKKWKFCLSFYVTEDNKDLSPILLKDTQDIYLPYWIAHLVPLYQETKKIENIYTKNKRLKSELPNYNEEIQINIWNDNFRWATKIKTFLEKIYSKKHWIFIENLIKRLRIPVLKNKVQRLWNKWKQIVISDAMLKFHDDKRVVIAEKYIKTK